jgi:hypothetical protein
VCGRLANRYVDASMEKQSARAGPPALDIED